MMSRSNVPHFTGVVSNLLQVDLHIVTFYMVIWISGDPVVVTPPSGYISISIYQLGIQKEADLP